MQMQLKFWSKLIQRIYYNRIWYKNLFKANRREMTRQDQEQKQKWLVRQIQNQNRKSLGIVNQEWISERVNSVQLIW